MWWFPSFAVWSFAFAAVACACGPIIIHLLNRRRYRTVQWAAMDFLKEAMQRNRRILHLRDMVLLAMRTLAVLLFGLALAQPFFTRGCNQAVDERQPLHAIVVIDNSLSMGYEALDGTLLDKAKDRARRLIDQLPSGSKITVLPACGSRDGTSFDPYDTKDGALDAIGKIELVDRSTSLAQAVNLMQRAIENGAELSKRVVVFSDQQATNWRDADAEVLKKLQDWQLVAVAPAGASAAWENSWVADIEVADGLADIETPTTIIVKLQHQGGGSERSDMQVKLSYGDTVIGERAISLEAGASSKQVEFEYVFNTLTDVPEPDHPIFVPLKAEIISDDSLAADNVRYLALPVVAGLPVVFVDQYGSGEDAARNHLGETRHLRKLLAPKTSRTDAPRQLVKIRHITQGELDQEVLQDARLVVLAGLKEPQSEETVSLLRDYVRQGGRLVIAAGADFDPARWQELAWREGDGILPLPLKENVGEVPEVAGANTKPFSLSFASMNGNALFELPSTGSQELQDLYEEPYFFKAVATDITAETREALRNAARERLTEELKLREEIAKRRETLTAKQTTGEISAADQEQIRKDEASLAVLAPHWLTWSDDKGNAPDAKAAAKSATSAEAEAARTSQIELLVQQQLPSILARFDDRAQTPFLIARKQGQGEVLFVATGLLSSWNTLPKTNAILMFDRLLRTMTRSTLPQRNYEPVEQLTLPVPAHQHDLTVSVTRPQQLDPEPLDIGFIGGDRQGVTLHGLYQRGVYRVAGVRHDPNANNLTAVAKVDEKLADKPVWEVPVVVNGAASESELLPLTRAEFEEKTAGTTLRWVEASEDISLAGAAIRGQASWWYLALAALILLLLEMVVLAWPALRSSPAGTEKVAA
ncbi:BatA domain-containing protein [Anatilimnocola floriformis]|uniref:BatA domain-containing protein n=1 Tax=Anatilimnocola floriformis TaxID=2948575 RepID=UPI0020C3B870|nr:BatA domain-containing protein [Anatilimnocola floriformis]